MRKCAAIFEKWKKASLKSLETNTKFNVVFIGLLNCLDIGIAFSFLHNKMISVGNVTNMLYNIAASSTWVYYNIKSLKQSSNYERLTN